MIRPINFLFVVVFKKLIGISLLIGITKRIKSSDNYVSANNVRIRI